MGGAVTLAGILVIVSGFRDRVMEVAVDDRALLVYRARRSPTRLAWSEVLAVRAPRIPLGGWRVTTGDRSTTLMPSDVLGNEWVLLEVIRRAGLVRNGRRWIRSGDAR